MKEYRILLSHLVCVRVGRQTTKTNQTKGKGREHPTTTRDERGGREGGRYRPGEFVWWQVGGEAAKS